MKNILNAVFLLVLTALFSGAAMADEGTIDIQPDKPLVLKLDGQFSIQGAPEVKGIAFKVDANDKNAQPVKGLGLAAKPTAEGMQLIIKRETGTASFVGSPAIQLKANPKLAVRLYKVKGDFQISDMEGVISGRFQEGVLTLARCSGKVDVEIDDGKLVVKDHRATTAHFLAKMEKGEADVEVGGESPATGELRLNHGRAKWSLLNRAPVTFRGEIKQGLITCSIPVSRKTTDALQFTSQGGGNAWLVVMENGVLEVKVPEPLEGAKRVWY